MTIQVCIGSACHRRGSYDVKRTFENLIAQHGLGDRVQLQAAFCLGHCEAGVSVAIDGEVVTGVTPQSAAQVFQARVLAPIGSEEA